MAAVGVVVGVGSVGVTCDSVAVVAVADAEDLCWACRASAGCPEYCLCAGGWSEVCWWGCAGEYGAAAD